MNFGIEEKTDLYDLYVALVSHEISCKIRLHPVVQHEPQVKNLIGYFPTGEYQILIEKDDATYSVIRGAVSFGLYEIMKIEGKGNKFEEPERFETPEELIKQL